MNFKDNKASEIKIAYIGGGSRGWAWGLMSDLVSCDDISGDVYLYDIDYEASKHNEEIGNRFNDCEGAKSRWSYHASKTPKEALTDADFVVISILPGTFDEMESDVHLPEKYGIYQSVGDTTGPGGIVRAMRTIPMYEEIALYIKDYCPNAWVISYTNPMSLCTKALYHAFPEIKAFGCCHEVFSTQDIFRKALKEFRGIEVARRNEIKLNPIGVNHFTWVTKATYHNMDLFPVYEELVAKYKDTGFGEDLEKNWFNKFFNSAEKVKMDLFDRYGVVAAAGDRHLAEFCPGNWYLKNPETVESWSFGLTPVSWRKDNLKERLQMSEDYRNGNKKIEIKCTGEEGVDQIRALIGLNDLVTNVNIPNVGQIPNLPIGAIVETNAAFRANSLTPVMAGDIPAQILPLISRACTEQEAVFRAIAKRSIKEVEEIFVQNSLVTCSLDDAKKLFKEMVENTKKYLTMYK